MKNNDKNRVRGLILRATFFALLVCLGGLLAADSSKIQARMAGGLTGNWAVKVPRTDGTNQWAYFNLKQDGAKITGTIRVTQFYYAIFESTGDADAFTITGKMRDGNSDRTVKYEGKLVGDELHLATRRRPEDKPTESVAKRVPDGEGATPRASDPSGTKQWEPFNLDYDRFVTAIKGDQITIDAPIVCAIEQRWGGGEILAYDSS